MIVVGIDDTDVIGTRGTNQLARVILRRLGARAEGALICRHQLLDDPRVPCTSKNGSASIQLPALSATDIPRLQGEVRGVMRAWFVPGSDPGLCIAGTIPETVQAFGRLCQNELVTRAHAHTVARSAGVYLEGLGGTEQGVVGALAAIGLAATGEDGRVVHLASWPSPDSFSGPHDVREIRARGVDCVECRETGMVLLEGLVDVGKHLRPNRRGGRVVLFVEATGSRDAAPWRAIKL